MTALRRTPDDMPEDEDPMPSDPLPDDQQTVPKGPGEGGYSAAVRASWADPDIRAKRIASTKAALSRPEVHERVLEAAKRRSAQPSYRKMLSDRQRARMADPALRENMREKMREIWTQRQASGWKMKPRASSKPKVVPAKVFRTEPKFAAAAPERGERAVAKVRDAAAKVRGTIRPPAMPPTPPRSVAAEEKAPTPRDILDAAHAEFAKLLRKAHPGGYPSLLLKSEMAFTAPPRSMWA